MLFKRTRITKKQPNYFDFRLESCILLFLGNLREVILVKSLHLRQMSKKHLISVVGPTAIGKTELAIRLGEYFRTEILSCDSRQFYKEMKIGTAVPSSSELNRVRHHFIQSRSINENYNVGAFEKEALELLFEKYRETDIFIMVGGSGLYADAVIRGLDDFPEVDPAIRARLLDEIKTGGLEPLKDRLKTLDPKSYARIDIQNKQRLIRALEITEGTHRPFSSYWNKTSKTRDFETLKIGLRADRKIVYERINRRVDVMMDLGLLDEVRELYDFRRLNALQTVGYREIFEYLDGNTSLDQAVAEIKKNTRRFAKRQETWFKKDKDINWFEFDTKAEDVLAFIESRIQIK